MFFKESEKDQKCCKCDAVIDLIRLTNKESENEHFYPNSIIFHLYLYNI
jgi:hypothetical protein